MDTATIPSETQLNEARLLGADAALSAATWVEMDEHDAQSILSDVDPEVMDRYAGPSLSGEWADDATPESVAREVGLDTTSSRDSEAWDIYQAVADAWEEGRDAVWETALQAKALRVLGRIDDALTAERANEAYVDSLRARARS